jgi:inorganic pyrophosphatase
MPQADAELRNLVRLLFQAHPWHGVEAGKDAPEIVEAYIEIVPTDVDCVGRSTNPVGMEYL